MARNTVARNTVVLTAEQAEWLSLTLKGEMKRQGLSSYEALGRRCVISGATAGNLVRKTEKRLGLFTLLRLETGLGVPLQAPLTALVQAPPTQATALESDQQLRVIEEKLDLILEYLTKPAHFQLPPLSGLSPNIPTSPNGLKGVKSE